MAEMKAEPNKYAGEVRSFASKVESKFPQSDHLSQQQQHHLAEQYHISKKPDANYGEADRVRRRLIKEAVGARVYSHPVRRQMVSSDNHAPSSGSGHPMMMPGAIGNQNVHGMAGMGPENHTRYIAKCKNRSNTCVFGREI